MVFIHEHVNAMRIAVLGGKRFFSMAVTSGAPQSAFGE